MILDEQSVVSYLIERGVLADSAADAQAERLAGGYINQVFRVGHAGREFVVKQALEQSRRTVLQADIERAHAEVAAMRAIKDYLGEDAPTPAVLDYDPDRFISVMTAAPRDAVLYHDELCAGRPHPDAATAIGSYAARLHHATTGDPGLAQEFAANPGFKLRDQSIRSAIASSPDLGERIAGVLDRNLERRETLVDYDITPKNVLVHGGGITKLDFECVQFGDPAFDYGIVVGHFMLYALALPQWAAWTVAEGESFADGYEAELGSAPAPDFIERAAEYAAVMMLGRVTGDLVLDFCASVAPETISVVRRILAQPPDDVHELLALAINPSATGTPADVVRSQ